MASEDRLMLFIPMYNCAPQIPRVLAQLDDDVLARFDEIFLVDNGSRDDTVEAALRAARGITRTKVVVAVNDANYGLGGSHKVAMARCLEQRHRGLVVFHGDDQGRIRDLLDALPSEDERAECVLGARFMPGSSLPGYAPLRIAVNVAFNGIFSAILGAPLWDLGSGLNYYSRAFIARRLWEGCADDLTFNYHLLARSVGAGASLAFVPISWREDDQVSNASLLPHGLSMLRIVTSLISSRGEFLRAPHSDFVGARSYRVVSPC